MTAGKDGYIKWWPMQKIEDAEPDETLITIMNPETEFLVNKEDPAKILDLIKGNDHWLVLDAKGRLIKIAFEGMDMSIIWEFQSGSLVDMKVPGNFNAAASLSETGSLKVWDFGEKRDIISTQVPNGGGTVMTWCPTTKNTSGRVFACG
jgi:hypothetical protein